MPGFLAHTASRFAMPIYAYRCEHCGHAQDVLRKVSDPVLTVCPACGEPSYRKQVTAAGFQLKGSGWYVTDFKGGDKKPPAKSAEAADGAGAGGAAPTGGDGATKAGGEAVSNGASPAAAKTDAKSDGAKAPAAAPAATSKPAAPKTGEP
jgi:putative FmdB family regulatory protein